MAPTRFPALLALFATLLMTPALPTEAVAGSAQTEAARQLELARVDLGQGNVDRAIHAATSARRLDPTLIESLLVQAQAAELKGDLAQARVLIKAYQGGSGADADPAAQQLLDRIDRAEPVQAKVERREDGTVVVTFAARDFLEDPTLHWKVRGAWQSIWMDQDEQGLWVATIEVKNASKRGVEWWVEPSLGTPVLDDLGKGEGKPFLLALK